MLAGKWVTGKSHEAYMAEFGVGFECVKRWASEAYLFLRLCQGNREDIRGRILAGIETVQRLALEKKRTHLTKDGEVIETPEPDMKAYLASLEFFARVHGADKPDEQPQETVSEAELAELLRARGYEVKAPDGEGALPAVPDDTSGQGLETK